MQKPLSLIPVRDAATATHAAKTPYADWKQYMKSAMSPDELARQLIKFGTNAVAVICGEVSGNLEIIDIDEKNLLGISARYFALIKEFFPSTFAKLSIVKTPSGGHHIRYQISDGKADGNKKLAYPQEGKMATIETRGEGGYALVPPSAGYVVIQNAEIQEITYAERCNLIALAKSLCEREVKVLQPRKPRAKTNTNYSSDPFEDYNASNEAQYALEEGGWKRFKENKQYVHFTRDGKDSGVSGSYIKSKGCFYVFTSSTELQEARAYSPSYILYLLRYRKDGKAMYKALVEQGYGKLKPEFERKQAKKLAEKGKSAPANFSEEAKKVLEQERAEIEEKYPYGVFWKYNNKGERAISRQRIIEVSQGLGFRYDRGGVVRIQGFKIERTDERAFQDVLKSYIKEEEADEYEEICDVFESFMQRSGSYIMKRLEVLDRTLIVKDTRDVAYKFFSNGYLHINKDRPAFFTYDTLKDRLVFAEKVQSRDYKYYEGGKYVEFLKLATNFDTQSEHIKKALGFLSHDWKDETTAYMIVLTEECADPQSGGGSGKNVFCNLLSNTTTYTNKNGSQVKFDEKFFQSWNGQRVMAISDVPKNFDFEFLKEPTSGSLIWKKLFKDEVEVKVEDSPKFIIQTNFSYEVTDGGLRRRIIPIEFTDYFTRCGGIDQHFGCHFPNGWNENDWNGFDTMIAESIMLWIRGGCKLSNVVLSKGGQEKQFVQTYGTVIAELLEAKLEDWKSFGEVSTGTFKADLIAYYEELMIPHQYRPSMQKLNKAIREKWPKFNPDYQKRENGTVKRYYFFNEVKAF